MYTKGILLDRDGVLIKDNKNYTKKISEVQILPGTREAITSLWEHGYTICIVTNQSGISKNLYTHDDVKNIHEYIESELKKCSSGKIHWYYCPHQDSDACSCRKPKAGLLQRAVSENNFIPDKTWMVGDNIRDIEAGKMIGCPTCLVLTGLGKNFYKPEMSLVPEKVHCDLYEFVENITKEGEIAR